MHWIALLWICAVAVAQTVDPWKSAMDAAEKSGSPLPGLKRALEMTTTFPESDVRRFETLVRLVEVCAKFDDGCGDAGGKKYTDRALELRSMVLPEDERLADLVTRLGDNIGTKDEVACYQQAFEIRQKTGPNGELAAKSLSALASAESRHVDGKKARATMDRALRMLEKTASPALVELLQDSASLFSRAKDRTSEQREYDRALETAGRIWKPSQSQYIELLQNIALSTGGLPAYAESIHKRILAIHRSTRSELSAQYVDALSTYALFLRRQNRHDESERHYRETLAISEKIRDQSRSVVAHFNLARLNEDLKRENEAVSHAESALKLLQQMKTDVDRTRIAHAQSLLIELYARTGQEAKSDALLQEYAQYARLHDQHGLIRLCGELADLYEKRGDYQRAANLLESAIATMDAVGTYAPDRVSQRLTQLARVYQALGRHEEAGRVSQRAIGVLYSGALEAMRSGDPKVAAALLTMGFGGAFVLCCVCLAASYVLSRRVDRRLNVLFHGQPAPLEIQRIQFRGNGATLFSIRIRNLLLSLLTLGVYSFWGKATARRYVCSQAEFDWDRFVFHGVGRELFFGWLKGLPFIAFILVFPNVMPLVWQTATAIIVAQVAAIAALFILWPIARAGAYRYRLNRMSWRGIRFSFRGSTGQFLSLWVAGAIVSMVTLGLYYPTFQMNVRRYLFSKSWFGDRTFEFHGRGRDLLPTYFFALPLSIGTFGFFWAWFSALRHRYYWANTTLGDARFRCTVTGPKLLRLWLGNVALLIGTLGLGLSWVTTRTLDFWTDNIELVGDPSLSTIRQDAQAVTAMGESFADFLGFDLGF